MSYVIYSQPDCIYCMRAKVALNSRQIPWEQRDAIAQGDEMRARVQAATGVVPTTVPQIFRGEDYVGGFTDLQALLRAEASQ